MDISRLAFFAAIFGLVTSACWLAMSVLTRPTAKPRAEARNNAPRKQATAWLKRLGACLRPFAKLSVPKEGWQASGLRLQFLRAGYRGDGAATTYLIIKSVLVILGPCLWLWLHPAEMTFSKMFLGLVLIAGAGYYIPDVVLRNKIAKRQQELLDNFPDAVDLLTVCVEAGLGLDAALVKVTEELKASSPTLSEELHLVNLELRAGGTRQHALRNLALRTGLDDLNALVAMLVQAERFGTSIADSLRVYASELRSKRRLKAEEAAAKIALKLLFPLIFCLFPALMAILMGPGAINIYRNMFHAM